MASGTFSVNSEVASLTVGANDTDDIKYNSVYVNTMSGYSLKKIGNIVIFSFVVTMKPSPAMETGKVLFAVKNSNILPTFNTGEQIHFPVTVSAAWNAGTATMNDAYMIPGDINVYNRFPIATGVHVTGTMIWAIA